MLYELFLFSWAAVGTAWAAIMVFGGLLCVVCAVISRRRAERSSAALINHASHHNIALLARSCPSAITVHFMRTRSSYSPCMDLN